MNSAVASDIVVDNFPAAHRSIRIAFVTETYPPEVNGVAITTARVVEGLRQRNHDIQLIRLRQGAHELARQPEGAPQCTAPETRGTSIGGGARMHEVLMRGLPIPSYPNLRMGVPCKRLLVKTWSTRRPDVVHIATEGPLGWSALQAALHLKLPVTSDFRTNFHAYSRHYGIGWLHKPIMAYLRKFHNRTLCTMVPTEALRRDLEASGFRNLTVVSRGVDTAQFSPGRRDETLRQEWGASPQDLVVVHVGRLASEKNLTLLAAAFEAIQRKDSRARLVMVGTGPLMPELRLRCPTAVFAGQRTGDDLARHYASADLFLFPSLTETFGNVTPEAMASGLPVVAFDYAAAAQLINQGENGVRVPFGDSQTFISRSLDLALDTRRRQTLGGMARRSACEWGWERVVPHFEAVLARAMSPVGAL
jgi:glycosyltransferase involved in cell wall biosynthesis